ncbi:hypothetical protein [Nocardia goodfellowii]|uniref:MnhB-related membrane protein n=1 Tax=Nocardia goodfellowii TaxID=882446 RepID=A0ABS4QM29_9NOCA|nr:hypothetical protein [Nocardia goodfellowii]MBP2192756.1 putative MnhB-related membrane protein [Nocardia goodfellowii]
MEYPISLAVEDFAPVLLTVAGVLVLRNVFPARRGILAAAALLGAGGFAKATAKLIAAAGGPDLPWLRNLLFPLLTLGFAVLAWVVVGSRAGRIPPWLGFLVPGLTLACALGAVLARDPLPMLVSTTVFATLTGGQLILLARARGDAIAAGLFGTQLLVFFLLGPLASRPDQTVALQWAEQLCNTAAQAAFLVAARRLSAAPVAAPTDEELIR